MGSAPAAAAAVGYNTETLGPSITVGGNWNNYDFFGTNPSDINVTQNADGSVTIDGGGNTYNGQLATATLGSNGQVVGEAFGGGLYAQATISVQGPSLRTVEPRPKPMAILLVKYTCWLPRHWYRHRA